MKSECRRIAKRIVAACVVATGFAILWAVVLGWLAMIGQSLGPAGQTSYDSLMVAADGTPVIQSSKSTGDLSLDVGRRTLDGKAWPMDDQEFIQGAFFPKPYEEPGLIQMPLLWDQGRGRIIGGTDGKDPPAAWYFVRDNGPTGEVYVTGYDGISKLPIGYIGRDGFRASKPTSDEQFVVPKSRVDDGLGFLVSSDQNLEERRLVRSEQIFRDAKGLWTVDLLGTDRLWEVDLRQRSARARIRFDGAMSMGRMRVNRTAFDGLPTPLPDERTDKEKEEERVRTPVYGELAAVRQIDRLVLFNLHAGKKETFLLSGLLRDRWLSAYLVGADQVLINTYEPGNEYWSGGSIALLMWSKQAGRNSARN